MQPHPISDSDSFESILVGAIKAGFPSPAEEVREKLRLAGAPCEPEQIGVTRARFRDTCRGVPYMRNRYFGLDLVERLGLMDELLGELFGPGGIWEAKE